jgi:hypothetical protein
MRPLRLVFVQRSERMVWIGMMHMTMAARERNRVNIGRSGVMGGEPAGSKARNSWLATEGFGLSDEKEPYTASRNSVSEDSRAAGGHGKRAMDVVMLSSRVSKSS